MAEVTLNPPERKQRLSAQRIAEIGQIAAGMPHDVPVAGWLADLCADLLDALHVIEAARAMVTVCTYPCGDPRKCGNCNALRVALEELDPSRT